MNPTLSRKLSKVLETRTDNNKDLLTAVENLSTFYGENSLEARRNLRGQIEKKGIETNMHFLQVLLSVQKHLDEVEQNVAQMKNCCNEMSGKLQTTKDMSGRLLQQADQLNKQRKTNETQLEIAKEFLKRFQLTQEEQELLKGPVVDASFFQLLDRVAQIHTDCKILLRTQHQTAGLEVMDMMILLQETAYGKLYKWVRSECRKFEDQLNPEIPIMLKNSIEALKDRPGLLNYCLDEISSSRNRTIVKGFLVALTEGGPNGMPRPIEYYAHDPLRYVGDMLAWIHQTTASEVEFISSLLPKGFGSRAIVEQKTEGVDRSGEMRKVLNSTLEGVYRPFKIRLAQVLGSQPGVVVIFKIFNLLDFYARTVVKLTGEAGALPAAFIECKAETLGVFIASAKEYGEKMQRTASAPGSTLVPSQQFYESTNQMVRLFLFDVSRSKTEICRIYQSSLVPASEREAQFRPILTALVDPITQTCTLCATRLTTGMDMAVYMINCYNALQGSLSNFEFVSNQVEALGMNINAHMDTLVEEQASTILAPSALATKLSLIQNKPPGPLSKTLAMDPRSVSLSIQSFESLIRDSTAFSMVQCEKLINSSLRTYARTRVVQLIYDSYMWFYNAICDPDNQYDNPHYMFSYKPQQIQTLLDAAV
ncbi:Component of oligomeric golgi complex 6 [Planoprotostelium fungivorum]|uniref:Conserved oligomeric Golgi complex subunit 6 n=1 Tax=Planoprotostelium fungivorum TaxID=1890364 RepID=A0A2P6NRG8_9EUKA|nr:Component of oligomeric golgi complex 6 [Planoprotostelium fungivorum]